MSAQSAPVDRMTAEAPLDESFGPLERLHEWLYPSTSPFFWYRKGTVKRTPLSWKYVRFFVLSLLVALVGSGGVVMAMMTLLSLVMKEYWLFKHGFPSKFPPLMASANVEGLSELKKAMSETAAKAVVDRQVEDYIAELCADPVWIVSWMFMAGLFTFAVYYLGAETVYQEYYVRKRLEAKEWKCQPDIFPSEALLREERLLGCFNGFMSGFMGTGLFFLHQNRPFLKFYYDTSARGFRHYICGCVLVFIWVEFYSYWIHRILHHKSIYKCKFGMSVRSL